MINTSEILQTVRMITEEKLDIRTITMGISLYDCVHPDRDILYRNVYDRITTQAKDLVRTGEALEREFGIPIVNKRISVTPASLVAAACGDPDGGCARDGRRGEGDGRELHRRLHRAGAEGHDRWRIAALIASLPEALSTTERVCSSVNVASTRAGIDMDAVRLCGQAVKDIAAATADTDASGCMKLVVFANAVEDNPFMAGAFHGAGRGRLRASTWAFPAPAWSSARLQTRRRAQPFDVRGRDDQTHGVQDHAHGSAGRAARLPARLNVPFGIVDLSLAPTPAMGDSVAHILEEMGLEVCGMPRHDGGARAAQRRGEEGRRDGVRPCRRPFRRVYPGQRGCRHDRRGARAARSDSKSWRR